MKLKSNKRAVPSRTNAAGKTSGFKMIPPKSHLLGVRKPLPPERRGPFWQSVGDAIEAARAGIGGVP